MSERVVPEMVSVAEVAKRLGTSRVKVRQMCRERTLPFMWSQGSSYFIVRAAFEKHMAGEPVTRSDIQPIPFLRTIRKVS